VNVAGIEGIVVKGEEFWNEAPPCASVCYGLPGQSEAEVANSFTRKGIREVHLFMNVHNPRMNTFYPFHTKFVEENEFERELRNCCYPINASNTIFIVHHLKNKYFNGIFHGYSYMEFVVYSMLGFAIVFLPKLWNSK
jgi:hypothetical protein